MWTRDDSVSNVCAYQRLSLLAAPLTIIVHSCNMAVFQNCGSVVCLSRPLCVMPPFQLNTACGSYPNMTVLMRSLSLQVWPGTWAPHVGSVHLNHVN